MNGTATIQQLQPYGKNIPRRQSIPILYTKGTHYDVGFDVVIMPIYSNYFIIFREETNYSEEQEWWIVVTIETISLLKKKEW